MAFLFNWLKAKPVQPARVPTDTVIPLHYVDSDKIFRDIVMNVSLRFDHVLDVEKLVGALENLLEKPGWRKLGARIRCNESGKYEYHVPAAYTKERPAISFSQTKYDIRLAEHPIGSKLPRPNGTVQLCGGSKDYRSLFVSDSTPSSFDEWLYTDRPQIVLHIVSFEDATLLTVTWIHSFGDAMSLHVLFDAWTAMLEGREDDVPEFYGELEDPLATLGAPPDPTPAKNSAKEEEFILKDKRVTDWKIFRFVLNMLWDLLMYRKEEVNYMIVPPAFFESLRTDAIASLTAPHPDPKTAPILTPDTNNPPTPSNPKPPPFLSDGDILCAWWTRLVIASLPGTLRASPTRTIQLINVFNMRDLLRSTSPALLPKGPSYAHNCVSIIHSFFTLRDMLTLPLGYLAARLRSDLVLQTTRPQVEARWRIFRAEVEKSGHQPLYGEGDMLLSPFSNWHKARMFDVDFGGAVVGGEKGMVAKPVFAMPDATVRGMPLRLSGNLSGRDGEGNWWLAGILTPETWRNLEKKVAEYNGGKKASAV